ncbi:YbfB/YjiJ family MFS transporter [Salipiger bermudensis]|uniref:YbfB/YjiJ family MFS transporter n=1 Tax=Salipiger bermudensis TaxID=344736 RepID=UPI0030088F13
MEQAMTGSGRRRTVAMVFAGGIAAQLLTIGIARFSFTPLLPVMLDQTALSPVTGGLLGGAIYAGYLAATLLLSLVRAPATRWALYRAGIVLAVLTCFTMAIAENSLLWAISRFLAGASGAAGMLLASEFLLGWLTARGGSRDLAPHFAGLGLGISLSGVVALSIAELRWDGQWLAFGALALVLAPACWLLVPAPAPLPAPTRSDGTAQPKRPASSAAWFWLFGLAYLTAGWGYAVGATFYVSILGSNMFWILLGLACSAGAIAGSAFARRFGAHLTLTGCYVVQIVALAMLAVPMAESLALLSAALFGGTFIAIVSLSLAEAGIRAAEPGRAMARMTLMYGIGQVGGPLVTGALRSATGSYTLALLLAALLMALGILVLFLSRRLS